MMKKLKIILMCFLLLFISASAQTENKYFVVTVEVKNKPNLHGIEKFYWIIPLDSLKTPNDFFISALYLEDFSKSNLVNCIDGKTVDIFSTPSNSDFNFSQDYKSSLLDLGKIIYSKRRKIQTITKKFSDKKETVSIYLTPICGEFSICNAYSNKAKSHETLSLPIRNFKDCVSLWNDEKMEQIMLIDFSKFSFSNTL